MQAKPSAVVFGAGSVGRGFLGQLFTESGYEVVFIDIDEPLVAALGRQRSYTLRLAGIEKVEGVTIRPVRAVSGLEAEQVADEVARASLLATAAGARALPAIGESIGAGLIRRWESGRPDPLNIVICENLRDAAARLRRHVEDALPDGLRPNVAQQAGFVPAVIARMSPVPTLEQRAADPTLIVAEPYKVLPVDHEAFSGPIPGIVGLMPVSPFAAYVERKLFIHNAGHAMLGYLGYRRGYAYGYNALTDPLIRPLLDQALDEAGRAVVNEHDFEAGEMAQHVEDLLTRFGNRALADPVDRLARDPLRKLAPQDRLVGAARLADKHGISPTGLAWGIAAALAYDNPGDAHAVELQTRLAQEGLSTILEDLCHIGAGQRLADLVRSRYRTLHEEPDWQR